MFSCLLQIYKRFIGHKFIGCTSCCYLVVGKSKDTEWLRMFDSILPVVVGYNRNIARIFFPAAGNRNGTGLNNRGSNGNYWSSSLNSSANGYNLNFNSGGVNPANNNNRFNGFSVRAVQHLLTLSHQGGTIKV